MERLSGTNSSVSGLPWDKYRNSKLFKHSILGITTQEAVDQARKNGWIVFRDGIWKVAVENISCHEEKHTVKEGFTHQKGDYVRVVNQSLMGYKAAKLEAQNREQQTEYELENQEQI